MYQNFFNNLIW